MARRSRISCRGRTTSSWRFRCLAGDQVPGEIADGLRGAEHGRSGSEHLPSQIFRSHESTQARTEGRARPQHGDRSVKIKFLL